MRSMTGFGRAIIQIDSLSVSIELSSVNKRNIEVVLQGPREWQIFEIQASKIISEEIERGRVRISISAQISDIQSNQSIDFSSVEKDATSLLSTMVKLGQEEKISPTSIIELYKIKQLQDTSLPSFDTVTTDLQKAMKDALHELIEMKKTEGAKLLEDMTDRVSSLRKYSKDIKEKANDMPKLWKNRLIQRLKQNDLGLDLNDERVLKEMSIFSEKCDISEEITRIDSHLIQLDNTLISHGSIGRKIEFLLQEVGRELNTICSKSTESKCTNIALNAKAEVEKLREQAMNVE
ncbi:MAG: YicC family protein [Opitutae bacterium]|nr:YicC family protein [Opitutae bacterium]HAD21348.1 YicC family protein [Opitutae bacterium]